MRIKGKVTNINYARTKQFFSKRAEKFQEDCPYSVTMYQDEHKELVKERNQKETEKLLPKLHLTKGSKVLDIACGIGRWADAISDDVLEYCGVDFSKELIEIAKKRNTKEHFTFLEGAANEVEQVLLHADKGKYNTILMMGILIYLNDEDVLLTLEQLTRVSEEHAVICIREPIGKEKRLTLKDFFSEELKDNYNAIYRTQEELLLFFNKTLLKENFKIVEEGFLFEEDSLNNRKETVQYYYLLQR